MRRLMFGLAIVLGLSFGASTVMAQATGVFSDPFSLYYGLVLPKAAADASRVSSTDVINNQTVYRQEAISAAERPGLYEDIQPFGLEDLDPSRPIGRRFTGRSYEKRRPATYLSHNLQGPPQYFGTATNGLNRYFPGLKPVAHGPNANIAPTRFGGGRRAPSASSSASSFGNIGNYR